MKKKSQEILQYFYTELDGLLSATVISMSASQRGIELCHHTLKELRQLLGLYTTLSIEEEIYFFKQIKPQALQYLLLFHEIRNVYVQLPRGSLKKQLEYLKERSLSNAMFLGQNKEFLFYMEQQFSYQDALYFTRNPKTNLPIVPEFIYYVDSEFATSHDVLWARLLAKQQELHFLRQLKMKLKNQQYSSSHKSPMKALHWTGSKIALVELIYALHNAHAINDGHEDIAKIAWGFEQLFDIKLDNVYKKYGEIKARKNERTRFIRKLLEGLSRKMEEEDS